MYACAKAKGLPRVPIFTVAFCTSTAAAAYTRAQPLPRLRCAAAPVLLPGLRLKQRESQLQPCKQFGCAAKHLQEPYLTGSAQWALLVLPDTEEPLIFLC